MIRVPTPFRAARVRSAALAWSLALAVALPRLAAVPTAQAESNDLFRDAAPLLVPGVVRGSTAAATSEVGEPAPSCLPPGYAGLGKTLWYRISGATAGAISGLVGEVGGFMPIVAIYQGSSLSTLQEVACGAELQLSAALSGGTYYLQIGGASGMSSTSGGADRFASGGAFRLMLSPTNDVSMVSLPTQTPSPTPEATPTEEPTQTPTETPTETPTASPTETLAPSATPTPTVSPSETPTGVPTVAPSPTSVPTATPPTCPPAPLAGATFSDDFSLDPNTNGKWSVYRYPSADTAGAAAWDADAKAWYLTRALSGRSAAVFARHALTSTRWEATFRYRIGGGSGADGLVFMFYKDAGYYCDTPYGPYTTGGAMGFQQDPDAIAGYGVEFDTFYNWEFDPIGGPHVALIKDSVRTHLAAAPDARSTDGLWHQATIRFDSGQLTVLVDGQVALQHLLSGVDYQFSGVGFGAGTGDVTNEHVIDDFVLRPLGDAPTATATSTPTATATATATATPTATVRAADTSTPAATATSASLSPLNDNFANALAVAVAPGTTVGPLNGTTRNATTESGEPVYAGDWSCYIIWGHRYYSTVWFEITPAATGTLTASTANPGTNFDVTLALYEEAPSVGSLGAPVACDNNGDNENPPGTSPQWSSIVRGPVTAGRTYYLQMGGVGGAPSGEYSLTFQLAPDQVSTSSVAATSTNTPTNTPAPSMTPTPTNTPIPTATNTPTALPTSTPQPLTPTPTTVPAERPSPPQNVQVVGTTCTAGSGSVSLRWDAPASGTVATYRVYRSTGMFFALAGTTDAATTAFTDPSGTPSSPQCNETYYYIVRAADSQGRESLNSSEVSAYP